MDRFHGIFAMLTAALVSGQIHELRRNRPP
jgi:hypothetical protein